MSTELTYEISSTGLEDTLAIARAMGSKLKGGEVVELISDLGGGKTAFVRGLAAGFGSKDQVRSPSFTLSNVYETPGEKRIYHYDFYRLSEPGIIKNELAESLEDPLGVVAIEWADIVEDVLPGDSVRLHIRSTGDNSRDLTFTYQSDRSYLFPINT